MPIILYLPDGSVPLSTHLFEDIERIRSKVIFLFLFLFVAGLTFNFLDGFSTRHLLKHVKALQSSSCCRVTSSS